MKALEKETLNCTLLTAVQLGTTWTQQGFVLLFKLVFIWIFLVI